VLDALREPIESGKIHISRTRAKIDYPARFQLIAAMNPSPTGHYQGKHNRASPEQTLRYLGACPARFSTASISLGDPAAAARDTEPGHAAGK
jgi:magnesium chelatase family protein